MYKVQHETNHVYSNEIRLSSSYDIKLFAMYFSIPHGSLKMVSVIGTGVLVMYISEPFPTRGSVTRCTDGWGGDDFCFLLTGARFEKLLEIYNKFRYMIRISSSISIIQASTVFYCPRNIQHIIYFHHFID